MLSFEKRENCQHELSVFFFKTVLCPCLSFQRLQIISVVNLFGSLALLPFFTTCARARACGTIVLGHVGRRRVPAVGLDCALVGGLALLEAAADWRVLGVPAASAPPGDHLAVAGRPREMVLARQLRHGRHDGRLQLQGFGFKTPRSVFC